MWMNARQVKSFSQRAVRMRNIIRRARTRLGQLQAMELRNLIGRNIQNYRRLIRISQEDLALQAGIDRSYMGRIELAKTSVSSDKLAPIARILGVEPPDLLRKMPDNMSDTEERRMQAEPLGRIRAMDSEEEIGLLYQWNNGATQIVLHNDLPDLEEDYESADMPSGR